MNHHCRPVLFVVLLGLLLGTAAGAATAPQEGNATIVPTPAERFGQAQALRSAGEPDAALQLFDALRADFPHDVDYALGRAQVLVELQRHDEALADLADGIRLAPDYEDVWKLRDRLLGMQEDSFAAEERIVLRKEAAMRFPDSNWWRAEGADDAGPWLLLLGAGYDNLSNQLPSWNNQFVEIHYRHSPSRQYRLQLARNARYSEVDTTVGLGAELSLSDGWFAGLDISSGGSADYLPEFGYSGHIGRALDEGWVVDLRHQRREYATATVNSTIGSVEKYIGAFRYAYSLGLSRLQGASSFSNHTLTANWYYTDDSSIGITLSTGDEAESLGNGQVLETNVKGITVNGSRKLSERFAVRWWLGVSEQGEFYRRRFLGLAVSVQL